jgi:hypothetical protein
LVLLLAASLAASSLLVSSALLAVNSAAGETRNYFVSPEGNDSNDGSRSSPWATISHAGQRATPGSTIHVKPGIYREVVVTTASGTADARIVYLSDEKWKAVIVPATRAVISWKNTGDYTDIVGFEVAGTLCNGIGLGGSNQRAISNNVHNSADGCNNGHDGGSGINDFNYGSHDNDIIENYVHDLAISDPTCGTPQHNMVQGIYQSNAGGHIDHNISANNCGWGIHLWHAATHAVITNNTITGNRSGGIVIGSGDSPCTTSGCPGGNDYTIVRNNIIAFNGGWGLHESGQDPGQVGIHNVYTNNLLFQNSYGDVHLAHNLQCAACISGKDPGFVSAQAGDYRLKDDSPAIGAGKHLEKSEMAAESSTENHHRSSRDIGAVESSK